MNKYILTLLLLLTSMGVMAEGEIVDSWDTTAIHFTCEYPIAREDGSILLLTEIGNVEFYLTGPNTVAPVTWGTSVGKNIIACEYFLDISGLTDGQYYVTATVSDIDLRKSVYATDPAVTIGAYAFEVQNYIKPPKSITGLMGVLIPRVDP